MFLEQPCDHHTMIICQDSVEQWDDNDTEPNNITRCYLIVLFFTHKICKKIISWTLCCVKSSKKKYKNLKSVIKVLILSLNCDKYIQLLMIRCIFPIFGLLNFRTSSLSCNQSHWMDQKIHWNSWSQHKNNQYWERIDR